MSSELPKQPVQRHKHIKTNHTAYTVDGWRLHIVRTQARPGSAGGPRRIYPVVLVPGMCSSGAYTFDLSPAVSLADWLADQMWDVWTVELRGNGNSDKPNVFTHRSHWWTVDDMVDKDLPAALEYITMATGCTAAHMMGHSMGGMILTAALAKGDSASRRMRSVTLVGSTCFLQGSWWAVAQPAFKATRLLYSVPAGATLRLYSNLAFTRLGIRAIDVLYFWPRNTDPALARAILARNFSSTSPGVISQFSTAFQLHGLRSSHRGHTPYADPDRLAAVTTPVMLIVGDRDRMCPPQGAAKQYQMFGSKQKKLVILGPTSGYSTHYGHFDILMGKKAPAEVWPQLQAWLESHDTCLPELTDSAQSMPSQAGANPNSVLVASAASAPLPPSPYTQQRLPPYNGGQERVLDALYPCAEPPLINLHHSRSDVDAPSTQHAGVASVPMGYAQSAMQVPHEHRMFQTARTAQYLPSRHDGQRCSMDSINPASSNQDVSLHMGQDDQPTQKMGHAEYSALPSLQEYLHTAALFELHLLRSRL